MRRSFFIVTLVLAQALAVAAHAADQDAAPAPLSIADALDRTWTRTPARAALAQREAEADAQLRAAAGWAPGAPTLGLGHRSDRLTGRNGQQEWELELATPLWLPGQREARHAAVQARRAVLGSNLAWQRLELAGQVREAWWQLAGHADAVAAAARRLQSAQALQADVERRWRAGDLARIDVNGAQAEAQAVEAEWVEAQGEQRRALSAWRNLTGAALPAAFAEEAVAALPASLDAHPRLVAAQARVDAAQAQLRLAERSRRDAPELALRWVHERSSGADPYARSLGVQLRLPLSSGPSVAAEQAGVRAELAQARAEWQRLREQLEIDAQSARQDLEAIDTTLALARSRAALAADSLQLLQKSFALGQADLPSLLRVRSEAHAAQAVLARQVRARSAAISRLNQALGVLP
jgi:cobalt-zinc-cadmium efflux system outer membrane protein